MYMCVVSSFLYQHSILDPFNFFLLKFLYLVCFLHFFSLLNFDQFYYSLDTLYLVFMFEMT